VSYDQEDFAKHHYGDSILKVKVSAALLKRPNFGYTVEELNNELGRENNEVAIEGIRRILRIFEDLKLIETESRGNPRGPPTKVYRCGKLHESYQDPILFSVFGKGREECLVYRICAFVEKRRESPYLMDTILLKDGEEISPDTEPVDLVGKFGKF